jgi:polar amino acid transport system substrate-binding protein
MWFWVLAAATWLAAPVANADTLDDIQRRGALRWAADAEGGGPFVYPRDDDPSRYQGFEVELAELLAKKLGVQAQFTQGQWGRLPELLKRGDADIVLNGYEWKPALAERYGTTLPYYVYELQMLVRKDDTRFSQLADLRAIRNRKLKIAVLGGSAAEDYVRGELGAWAEPVVYDGTTDAMRGVELALDGVDATLQDLPIVTYYEKRFPQLRRLGEPVAPGYYTILTRPEDERLVRALNGAILAGWQEGSIPVILERYGLWNDAQRRRALLTDERGNFRPADSTAVAWGGGDRPVGCRLHAASDCRGAGDRAGAFVWTRVAPLSARLVCRNRPRNSAALAAFGDLLPAAGVGCIAAGDCGGNSRPGDQLFGL